MKLSDTELRVGGLVIYDQAEIDRFLSELKVGRAHPPRLFPSRNLLSGGCRQFRTRYEFRVPHPAVASRAGSVRPATPVRVRQHPRHRCQRNLEFDSRAGELSVELDSREPAEGGTRIRPHRLRRHHGGGPAPQRVLY